MCDRGLGDRRRVRCEHRLEFNVESSSMELTCLLQGQQIPQVVDATPGRTRRPTIPRSQRAQRYLKQRTINSNTLRLHFQNADTRSETPHVFQAPDIGPSKPSAVFRLERAPSTCKRRTIDFVADGEEFARILPGAAVTHDIYRQR